MEVYRDRFGNTIKLTNKRRNHIMRRHPLVKPYLYRVSEVLSEPEFVKRSRGDADTFLCAKILRIFGHVGNFLNFLTYYRYYEDIYGGKYLLVVAKTTNRPIVLTCYITDRIKEGELIWKKN